MSDDNSNVLEFARDGRRILRDLEPPQQQQPMQVDFNGVLEQVDQLALSWAAVRGLDVSAVRKRKK